MQRCLTPVPLLHAHAQHDAVQSRLPWKNGSAGSHMFSSSGRSKACWSLSISWYPVMLLMTGTMSW